MRLGSDGRELRWRMRNWTAFPLLLAVHQAVEAWGLGMGMAIFLLACAALRPVIIIAIRLAPRAPHGCAWLGAFAAAAYALVYSGPGLALLVYGTLFALAMSLAARREAEA